MAVRTVSHEGHEHTVKTTIDDVSGLKVDDHECQKISEAFGWSDEKFDALIEKMSSYYKFQEAAEELNDHLPASTKISTLVDFLKSDAFKVLGIKLDNPNAFFMVGFTWNIVLTKRRGLGGSDILSMLASLKRDSSE